MSNTNIDGLLLQIISLLQSSASGGGGGGSVTVSNTPLPVTEQNPITGFNLESTQQSVLTELGNLLTELQKSTDFTTDTLIDSGNSNQLIFRKEELDETTGTYTISYEDMNGNSITPAGPLLTIPELELQVQQSIENFSTGVVCNNPQELSNITTLDSNYPLTIGTDNDSEGFLATSVSIAGVVGNRLSFTLETPRQSAVINTRLKEFVADVITGGLIELSFGDFYDTATDFVALSVSFDSNTEVATLILYLGSASVYSTIFIPISETYTAQNTFYLKYENNIVNVQVDGTSIFSYYFEEPVALDNVAQYAYTLNSNPSTVQPSATWLLQEITCTEQVCTTCDLQEQLLLSNDTTTVISNRVNLNTNNFTTIAGTISLASSSQSPLSENINRKYLLIQNISDTDMWINFGGAATEGAGSIKLAPSGHYELGSTAGGYMNTESVHIICSQAGKSFTIKEA